MNDRIKELRKTLNLSQKEFGNQIGLKSSISDIELSRAPITERTILTICLKFNVNRKWLETGKGSMFIENFSNYNEFFKVFNSFDVYSQDFLIQCAKNLL